MVTYLIPLTLGKIVPLSSVSRYRDQERAPSNFKCCASRPTSNAEAKFKPVAQLRQFNRNSFLQTDSDGRSNWFEMAFVDEDATSMPTPSPDSVTNGRPSRRVTKIFHRRIVTRTFNRNLIFSRERKQVPPLSWQQSHGQIASPNRLPPPQRTMLSVKRLASTIFQFRGETRLCFQRVMSLQPPRSVARHFIFFFDCACS
jgi:hypothetical protein